MQSTVLRSSTTVIDLAVYTDDNLSMAVHVSSQAVRASSSFVRSVPSVGFCQPKTADCWLKRLSVAVLTTATVYFTKQVT